jgi:hypothetical protein
MVGCTSSSRLLLLQLLLLLLGLGDVGVPLHGVSERGGCKDC